MDRLTDRQSDNRWMDRWMDISFVLDKTSQLSPHSQTFLSLLGHLFPTKTKHNNSRSGSNGSSNSSSKESKGNPARCLSDVLNHTDCLMSLFFLILLQ